MPKQFRWKLKRDLDQVVNNLWKAGNKLYELESIYRPSYPDCADVFGNSQKLLILIISKMNEIRDEI